MWEVCCCTCLYTISTCLSPPPCTLLGTSRNVWTQHCPFTLHGLYAAQHGAARHFHVTCFCNRFNQVLEPVFMHDELRCGVIWCVGLP